MAAIEAAKLRSYKFNGDKEVDLEDLKELFSEVSAEYLVYSIKRRRGIVQAWIPEKIVNCEKFVMNKPKTDRAYFPRPMYSIKKWFATPEDVIEIGKYRVASTFNKS